MESSPTIHSTFSVSSAHLCYGSLHNIWQGASAPLQGFPTARPESSGTIILHRVDHNVPAQNGTWNVFQLVGSEPETVAGWFAAHEDVDPQKEMDKILRVSGSPYEYDHGSTMNNDKTAQEGIFVINRYDWGYYDRRFYEEIGEGLEEDNDVLANSNSLGLVDCSDAQEMVTQWKELRPSERRGSHRGVWMYTPRGEYMFGRFGFNDEHIATRSFLFFSMETDFTRTSFKGISETLRKAETPQERFERRLSEGYDYSGIEMVHSMARQPTEPGILAVWPPPPPESEQLGPYDSGEYIFREQDIDALRLYKPDLNEHWIFNGVDMTAMQQKKPIHGFIDPWKQPLIELVNEMILSYLEKFLIPHVGSDNITAIAESLFPKHNIASRPMALDVAFYRYFTQPDKEPITDLDTEYVHSKIRQFLGSRSRVESSTLDGVVKGICRVVGYLLSEVFEMANNAAIDGQRNKMMPCDVRLIVFIDEDFRDLLLFSKVFWEGKPVTT